MTGVDPHTRDFVVRPAGGVRGEITVPGDKSISHRAAMLAALAEGTSEITEFLTSEDCLATVAALRAMGVEISEPAAGRLRVEGVGLHGLDAPAARLELGNSGTAMRLLTGLLAGQSFDSELTGDASLLRRPMDRVAAPLNAMGARIRTCDGGAPIRISGGRALAGMHYTTPVPSAQVKSALLLAGLYARGVTSVREPAVTRDHTERLMVRFGCTIESRPLEVALRPPERLAASSVEVPGDFSSAAFFIVAACIAAEEPLVIRRVGINPTRIGLLTGLRLMGGRIEISGRREAGAEPVADLTVWGSRLRGVTLPPELVSLAIDEFPALFMAAACADGETRVQGAGELRFKESDRLEVMATGLGRLGIDARSSADGMCIRGGPIGGGEVDSHGDHRIAMAFALAGLRARDTIVVRDVHNVATSFPQFTATARQIGLDIEECAAVVTE